MGESKEKGKTGRRYTDAQKKKILDFVAKQGRGGVTAAQKKFGVSYIAIARWRNGLGLNAKKGRPSKAGAASVALKAADIQREITRQIKPHLSQLLRVKAGIKALIKTI